MTKTKPDTSRYEREIREAARNNPGIDWDLLREWRAIREKMRELTPPPSVRAKPAPPPKKRKRQLIPLNLFDNM